MLTTSITKNNNTYTLRPITVRDSNALGEYFVRLSDETKRRFQPHPLTNEQAAQLCAEQGATPDETALRLILLSDETVIGYFILESTMSVHEASRYAAHGIELVSQKDVLFAPSILDEYQNLGLASLVMPHLLSFVKANNARSLVLMGGTQSTNPRAIAFYEKFGFEKFGGYETEIFNHDMRLIL
jgi:GNAT superfamily N-acetyltransferase